MEPQGCPDQLCWPLRQWGALETSTSHELSMTLVTCVYSLLQAKVQWDPRASLWNASQGTCFSCWYVDTYANQAQPSSIPELRPLGQQARSLMEFHTSGSPGPRLALACREEQLDLASILHMLCDQGWG